MPETESEGRAPAAEERYGRMPDVTLRDIAGEHFLIVLHAGESKMFSLNGMGVWFWQQLEQPSTEGELTSKMLRDYEVAEAVAAGEVSRFLAELTFKKLARRLS